MNLLKRMISEKSIKKTFHSIIDDAVFPCFVLHRSIKTAFEVYGYILTDAGYNFNTIDPNWFDVMRPTKLPKYKNEFGPAGNYFMSVRQTRLELEAAHKRSWANLKRSLISILLDLEKMSDKPLFI
jgi:hypothetical protein